MRRTVRKGFSHDFARSGVLVFGAVLVANSFNYVFYLLMGRTLSVGDYGTAMSLLSAVLLILGIATIGQTVIAKLAADLRAAGDAALIGAFSQTVWRLSLVAGLVICGITLALQHWFDYYLHLGRSQLILGAGASAAVGFVLLLQRGLLQGDRAYVAFGISNAVEGVVRAALLVPLARPFGVLGALAAFFAALVTAVTYGEIALRLRLPRRGHAAGLDLRRMLVTAGATGASSLGLVVLMFYDVILAKHYLTPTQAGLYGAAALAGRVLFTLVSFLPTVVLPEVSARSMRGHSDVRILIVALSITIAMVSGAAALCGLAPHLIIRALAGSAFDRAADLVLPYVIASGALALGNVLAMYAIARHRFGFVTYLLLLAVAEVIAVSLRHATAMEVVQDLLGGHVAIGFTMSVWILISFARARSRGMLAGATAHFSD